MSSLVTIEQVIHQVVEAPQDGLTMENFSHIDPNIVRRGGPIVGESLVSERVVEVQPK
jgi:hypothetical protein